MHDLPATESIVDALSEARRELALSRQALQRSRNALAAIADGVVITDVEGRIASFNPAASHLTGWPTTESVGRPLADVVRIIDEAGGPVSLLDPGVGPGVDGIGALVRRDGHLVAIDGSVAQVQGDSGGMDGYIIMFRNVTAAVRIRRELSWHANHDALTGLPNRRVLETRLERAIHSAAHLDGQHVLLYLDLDDFKTINDTGGHVAGDALLRQLAPLLRQQLREHDTFARIGGDEFAILLEHCGTLHADAIANAIRAAIGSFAFGWGGRGFRTGVSIGQVEFSGVGLTVDDIVRIADEMCYVAKADGRDRIAACSMQGLDLGAGRLTPLVSEPCVRSSGDRPRGSTDPVQRERLRVRSSRYPS